MRLDKDYRPTPSPDTEVSFGTVMGSRRGSGREEPEALRSAPGSSADVVDVRLAVLSIALVGGGVAFALAGSFIGLIPGLVTAVLTVLAVLCLLLA